MHRASLLVLAAFLFACTPMGPPITPLVDAGPRVDAGRDAPELPDAPEVPDAPVDAPEDAPVDAPRDAPLDAPSCDMRIDCDSNGSCETALGTVMDCMACDDVCPTRAGAMATCDFTTGCGFSCNAGFEDCNSTAGDGCEINTNTSLMNCGSCGMVCPTGGANTTRSCMGGDCIPFTCVMGFGDCDDDIATGSTGTGCEIDTRTSELHCGFCGNDCAIPAGAMTTARPDCNAGTCRMVCNTGRSNCDSDDSNGCERAAPTCT